MPYRINQKGFAAVEAVLIVIVIALVGGSGYFVWRAQKNVNTAYNAASKVAQSTPEKVTKKASTTAQTQKYLVIEEWGVRMKLSTQLADAYYVINSDTPTSAYLSTRSLVAAAPDCAADKVSVAAIYRLTDSEQQQATSNPDSGNIPGNVHIGDYWYGIVSAQAGCFDDSNNAAKTLWNTTQPRSGFTAAEKTLEAVPEQ